MDSGAYRKASSPRVPIKREISQDEFWLQQGTSGAINAFRQLTISRQKKGRKNVSLPGGKLKPLFKNHAAPPRNVFGKNGVRSVLPSIAPQALEAASASQYVMSGHPDNLPPQSPSTVRLYLCSNYEDMKAERAMLTKYAVPQLQAFCSQYGLYFQLVDLHWGVLGGAHQLQSIGNLRLQEIKACHNQSIGPAFVMLLGDKYGAVRLTPHLSTKEFIMLKELMSQKGLDKAALADRYYKLDKNCVPAQYVLDCGEDVADLEALHGSLKNALDIALEENKISKQRYDELTMSVLEEEIENGVFPLKDPRHQCLFYRREWQEVDVSHSEAPNMVDTLMKVDGIQKRDKCKQTKMSLLCERINQHLGPSHCRPYYLKWGEAAGRTWAPTPEYQTYLDTLCSDFIADCKHLVLQGLERREHEHAGQVPIYPEVLFQSHLWQSLCASFHGQDDLIFKVENFLQDPRRNMKPCVIYGPAGSGKTSTMAHLAKRIENGEHASVVVLRFLGKSEQSSSIYNVVVSITMQICMAYGFKVPNVDKEMNTLYRALQVFRDTIDAVSWEQASSRPLYVILDGIDQLQPIEESLRALWAITNLPQYVYLIISTQEKVGPHNLLTALLTHVSGKDGCYPLAPLSRENAKQVLRSSLQQNERSVTSEQEDKILKAFQANPDPLFLRGLTDYALKLTSYTHFEIIEGADVKNLFLVYLERLAAIHGAQTIRKVVGYLTISGMGIHEKELIDLLTCDAEVMKEIHEIYVINPDKVATFPPLAWARIRDDLRDLIEEHNVRGKIVVGWKHTTYVMCIGQEFGLIYPGIDKDLITSDGTSLTLSLHECITNMYLQENQECHSNIVSEWGLPNVEGVDLLSPHPVNSGHVLKLQNLPTHFSVLLPLEGIARLTKVMFGSLAWLRTKLKATSVQSILQDLVPVLTLSIRFNSEGVIEDDALIEDLKVIYEFLQLAEEALIKDPDSIINEILARLPGLSANHVTVQDLVNQATSAVSESTKPSLVPLYPCLPAPCNPLRHTFEGTTHIVKFLKKKNLIVMLCNGSSIDVWKLSTGELIHRCDINPEQNVQGIIPLSSEDFVIIAHYSHLKHIMQFKVWGIDTGITLMSSTFDQRFETLALDPEDKTIMVSAMMEVNRANDIWQRFLLAVDVISRKVTSRIVVEDLHTEGISNIIFARNVNPAGNGLLTVGAKFSNDLGFWDLDAGQLVFSLLLHCHPESVELVSEEALAFCISSHSGKVVIVNLKEGEIVRSFENSKYVDHSSYWISPGGHYILLATRCHGVDVINVASGKITKSIGEKIELNMRPSNGKPPTTIPIPTQIAVDEEGHCLFVGCLNGSIKIYCIATGEHVDTLHGHSKAVNSLSFDQEGMLYSAADDQMGRVWFVKDIMRKYNKLYTEVGGDVSQWDGSRQFEEIFDINVSIMEREMEKFPTEQLKITSMAMTADQKFIVTSSPKSPVRLWSTEDGQLIRSYKDGSRHGAYHVYLAYKDQFVVAHCNNPVATRTKILQVWRKDTGNLMKLMDRDILVYTSCVTPDGSRIFVVAPSEKKASGIVLGLYDLFDLKQTATLACNIYGAMDSTNLFLVGCINRTTNSVPTALSIIESEPISSKPEEDDSEETEPKADDHESVNEEVEKIQTYAVLDYCPDDGVSYFFNFTIEEDKISMDRHVPLHMDTHSPGCTVLLDDGFGISGAVDGSLVVWDMVKQEILATLVDPALLKAVKAGNLKYASSTGQPGHDGMVTCLTLCPNKQFLVSGGIDLKVRVWDVGKRQLMSVLSGHSDTILTVDVSQDGRTVISGSADENILIWNVSSQSKKATFFAHKIVSKLAVASRISHIFALCGKSPSNMIALKMGNV